MEEPDDEALDQSLENNMTFVKVMMILAVVAMAIVSSLIGGAAGWMVGGGFVNTGFNAGTLIGAIIGLAMGGCLGFFTIGPGRSTLRNQMKWSLPPDADRFKFGLALSSFSIYVTIHEVINVASSEGLLSYLGKKNDSFIEMLVGRKLQKDDAFMPNKATPVKRTCVQISGVFDEVFKLQVEPRDDTLELRLMDQDVVGDDIVGIADINISREIIGEGFPQKKGYKLMYQDGFLWGGGMRKTGVIIISFDPGEDFPHSLLEQLKRDHPMEFERSKRRKIELLEEGERYSMRNTNYGTLQSTQWNRKSQMWAT
eukprot:GEMP01051116.1.p1 GENE.GEMP01051116.1~~GEMP01051116.1.p1  ORF type:complete len:312 (+),score=66.13 GEMP01051116.1:318-1253(+)